MTHLELAKKWIHLPNGRQIALILLKNHAKEVLGHERTRGRNDAA